jgi:DNA modification methylase
MPIRPENKGLYPKNWPEIRASILARAENQCEVCGVENYSRHHKTGSHVVLTIMHLDHNPENCNPDNLKAACQLCHNSYDAPVRAARRKSRCRAEIATFPRELVERCLLAGTGKGDVVLDPFGGIGTTGLVAKKLRRQYVLIDLSEEYCSLARERLSNGPLLS